LREWRPHDVPGASRAGEGQPSGRRRLD
jgi:hypothetical protein